MQNITVVSAGLGSASTTSMLAKNIAFELEDVGAGVQICRVELRALAKDILKAIIDRDQSATLKDALAVVRNADALVMVSPTYNSAYSGLFKMFVDVWEPGMINSKPVLLAATGGTLRHSLALDGPMRSLFGYLRGLVMPTVVFATPEDWNKDMQPMPRLSTRIKRAAGELRTFSESTKLVLSKPEYV